MKAEYGLLIALIASVALIGYTHLSDSAAQPFENQSDEVEPDKLSASVDGKDKSSFCK